MKQMMPILGVLCMIGSVMGQESEVTEVTTATTTVSGGPDLIGELWSMDDATVLDVGQVDLRFTFRWLTGGEPFNNGDSSDDFVFSPSIHWGSCENVELFAEVPIWLGDAGDAAALDEGNADTNVGFTWRIAEPADGMPAVALKTTFRIPTGDSSNGVDSEARLILTSEYDSGIRSHVNVFGKSVDGDNWRSVSGSRETDIFGNDDRSRFRHFQWGLVLGLDGPLCGDGAVRWVLDYMNRSSSHYGRSNINMLEAGWEWTMSDAEKLGMAFQVGLDHAGDEPNFGASIAYTHALTY